MTRTERYNRLIVKTMGMKWEDKGGRWYFTSMGRLLQHSANPDYSTDAMFLPLLRWAREQEWWVGFTVFVSEKAWYYKFATGFEILEWIDQPDFFFAVGEWLEREGK